MTEGPAYVCPVCGAHVRLVETWSYRVSADIHPQTGERHTLRQQPVSCDLVQFVCSNPTCPNRSGMPSSPEWVRVGDSNTALVMSGAVLSVQVRETRVEVDQSGTLTVTLWGGDAVRAAHGVLDAIRRVNDALDRSGRNTFMVDTTAPHAATIRWAEMAWTITPDTQKAFAQHGRIALEVDTGGREE